jgi:hypothetical protein
MAGDQNPGMIIHAVLAVLCIFLFSQRSKWCGEWGCFAIAQVRTCLPGGTENTFVDESKRVEKLSTAPNA